MSHTKKVNEVIELRHLYRRKLNKALLSGARFKVLLYQIKLMKLNNAVSRMTK